MAFCSSADFVTCLISCFTRTSSNIPSAFFAKDFYFFFFFFPSFLPLGGPVVSSAMSAEMVTPPSEILGTLGAFLAFALAFSFGALASFTLDFAYPSF